MPNADYGRLTTMPSCEGDAHRSADSGRPLSSNAFDQPSVVGSPDNGPLSRSPVIAVCTARVSRTWPGVRRWTGGGIRAHAESVSEPVMIACCDPAGLQGRGTDERRPW